VAGAASSVAIGAGLAAATGSEYGWGNAAFDAAAGAICVGAVVRGVQAFRAGRAAGRGGAAAVRLGQAGERSVRAANDIGSKVQIRINGRTRIPDGLTDNAISEVKNVRSLSYTQQLRDYADFAQETGRRFDLYVRPDTELSKPLMDAVGAGHINLRFIQ
jgi:hypothetical protein